MMALFFCLDLFFNFFFNFFSQVTARPFGYSEKELWYSLYFFFFSSFIDFFVVLGVARKDNISVLHTSWFGNYSGLCIC
jgi:hypothetical protein